MKKIILYEGYYNRGFIEESITDIHLITYIKFWESSLASLPLKIKTYYI